jgi:hypothetical protein
MDAGWSDAVLQLLRQDDPVRKGLLVTSVVLGIGGLALALVPFRVSIPLGTKGQVRPTCSPPLISAWHRGPKDQVALWAVTVGTDKSGYEVRSGAEPWCGEKARPRLGISVVLLVVSGALLLRARRRSPAPTPAS